MLKKSNGVPIDPIGHELRQQPPLLLLPQQPQDGHIIPNDRNDHATQITILATIHDMTIDTTDATIPIMIPEKIHNIRKMILDIRKKILENLMIHVTHKIHDAHRTHDTRRIHDIHRTHDILRIRDILRILDTLMTLDTRKILDHHKIHGRILDIHMIQDTRRIRKLQDLHIAPKYIQLVIRIIRIIQRGVRRQQPQQLGMLNTRFIHHINRREGKMINPIHVIPAMTLLPLFGENCLYLRIG